MAKFRIVNEVDGVEDYGEWSDDFLSLQMKVIQLKQAFPNSHYWIDIQATYEDTPSEESTISEWLESGREFIENKNLTTNPLSSEGDKEQ